MVPEEGGSHTAPIGEDDFLKLSKALKTLNIIFITSDVINIITEIGKSFNP